MFFLGPQKGQGDILRPLLYEYMTAKFYKVKSFTDPDTTYIVRRDVRGHWGCNCSRWIFKKRNEPDCKHIDKVKKGVDKQVANL